MTMKRRNIPFSPPDMTKEKTKLASEAIISGWITTGPKTKEFEKKIAAYVGTNRNGYRRHYTRVCSTDVGWNSSH